MALPNVAANDQLLVSFRGTLISQRVINTFTFIANPVTDPHAWDIAIDELHATITGPGSLRELFLDCVPNNYTLDEIRYQVLRPIRLAQVIKPQVAQSGNVGASALVPNNAVVIERRGDLARRADVGAVHLPAPQDVLLVNGGLITPAYKTILQAFANQMKTSYATNFGGVVLRPTVYHLNIATSITYVTQTVVQETARVMRRRTVGLGE